VIDLFRYFSNFNELINSNDVLSKLGDLGNSLELLKKSKGRLLLFGNGASASIASHAALDFTKQGRLTSLCFHDPALLTAYANDYGYENVFKEIINDHVKDGDFCIFISVSGESPNIVRAAKLCIEKQIPFASFSGRKFDNTLARISKTSFWVNSEAYNIVENIHSIWLLSLVDYLIGTEFYEFS